MVFFLFHIREYLFESHDKLNLTTLMPELMKGRFRTAKSEDYKCGNIPCSLYQLNIIVIIGKYNQQRISAKSTKFLLLLHLYNPVALKNKFMYTTYHLESADEMDSQIIEAIKAIYKTKPITITVEESSKITQ